MLSSANHVEFLLESTTRKDAFSWQIETGS